MLIGFFLEVWPVCWNIRKRLCSPSGFKSNWTVLTGFTIRQSLLHLHEMWPAMRTRWWATIAHPALSILKIPPMPSMRFAPCITHLLRSMLPMSDQELAQLVLSKYELRQFHSAQGGIARQIIDVYRAMSTATRSWGPQVLACLCHCRNQGFSQERIDCKGLYAVLIPLETEEILGLQKIQGMRHPHPQEVALMNGLVPSHVQPSSDTPLRLDLAGVGQLASPLQGAWVLANMICQTVQQQLHEADISCRHVMANMCRLLLQERDTISADEGQTKLMKVSHRRLHPMHLLSHEAFATDGHTPNHTTVARGSELGKMMPQQPPRCLMNQSQQVQALRLKKLNMSPSMRVLGKIWLLSSSQVPRILIRFPPGSVKLNEAQMTK